MKSREEWGRFLQDRLEGRVLEPLGEVVALSPMTKGKKGLVFLVEGSRGKGVLRLYKDPLVMARTRKVYGLCQGAGVSVAQIHFFEMGKGWIVRGIWGLSLEEWVEPWRGGGSLLMEELARLHAIRRLRWGDPLLGRVGSWLEMEMERTHSRLDRWAEWRGVEVEAYREWLEEKRSRLVPLKSYSLIHGDLAPSNLGSRGGRPVLLDLDRARFAHPLVDVVALVHHFPRIQKEEVEDYLSLLGFTGEDWTFFLCLFHLKRLIRALKHYEKGEREWKEVVEAHEACLRTVMGNH